MPRSNKHKSHRQHKHGVKDSKEPSGSEEEEPVEVGNPKEGSSRKSRDEDVRGARAAKGSEGPSESGGKRKVAASEAGDLFAPGDEEASGEYFPAKRWKDKADVSERWSGGTEGSLEGKLEGSGPGLQVSGKEEKGTKIGASEKDRDSRRFGGSSKDDIVPQSTASLDVEEGKRSSSKAEASHSKRKPDRELREDRQSKEGKEKARDRNEMAVLIIEGSKSHKVQSGGTQEQTRKREVENSEWELKDHLRNPELEEEIEKRMRKRNGSREKDKWQEDIHDRNNRHLTSADEYARNGRYKDERDEKRKDAHYRDKYKEDNDRDHKRRDEKHREERSSRDQTDERSDNKHLRDESRSSGSHYKKHKLDSDHDASSMADHSIREKESRVKRRLSDENEMSNYAKGRHIKEPNDDLGSRVLKSSRVKDRSDSYAGNIRPDIDACLSKGQCRNAPSSSKQISKNQHGDSPKQVDSAFTKSPSEEGHMQQSVSPGPRDHSSVSSVAERVSEVRSSYRGRVKRSGYSDESTLGDVARSENDVTTYHSPVGRSPRLEGRTSPVPLRNKSSSPAAYEHHHSSSSRQSLDVDESKRARGSSKDVVHPRYFSSTENRGQDSPMEKPAVDIYLQSEALNTDGTPRNGNVNSSSRIFPLGHGVDGPLFISTEEDSWSQASDRKFNGLHKRSNELCSGRSQQVAWKGISNWTGPTANNFIPFQPQVGPGPAGFHPVLPQFPAPPIFGIRTPTELNHAGFPFHMHDGNRFSGHGRPYGWCNPGDDSCQPPIQGHLHGWDAGSAFSEDRHLYGKPDWDQSRRVCRGWEMKAEMWKRQNGDMAKDPEFQGQHPSEEPSQSGQSGQRPRHERQRPDRLPAESIEIKPSEDTPISKFESDTSVGPVRPKGPKPKKVSSSVSYYLSKLDISVDLAGPDLHEKYMLMQGSKGDDSGDSYAIPELQGLPGIFESNAKMCSTEKNGRMALLYHRTTNALLEKALVLYRKQKDQMKTERIPFLTSGLKFKNDYPAPDAGVLGLTEASFSPDCSLQDIDSQNENELENKSGSSEDDVYATATGCEARQFGCALGCSDLGGLNAEHRDDDVFEPVDDLHASGIHETSPSRYPSQVEMNEPVSEALKPDLTECSANLSRIPDSPENTH